MTKITKKQEVIHPVLKEIEHRWSPRAFDLQMPDEKYLRSMFEAARRAPSAFNDQPWSFIIGRKGDETYTHILTSLIDFNVGWAKSAPILMVACGSSLSSNGQQENTTYAYDTGQSIAYFSLQAMQFGIYTHQMAGFSKSTLVEKFMLPSHIHPLTVLAIGYPGALKHIPENLHVQEKEVKGRKEFNTFVFTKQYGEPSGIF